MQCREVRVAWTGERGRRVTATSGARLLACYFLSVIKGITRETCTLPSLCAMLGEAHATGGGTRGAMGAPEQTLALPSRQWLGEKMAREGAQMKVTSHVQVPVSMGGPSLERTCTCGCPVMDVLEGLRTALTTDHARVTAGRDTGRRSEPVPHNTSSPCSSPPCP